MVCTFEKGRMSAMLRLLGNGHYPELTTDETGHERLAAKSIHRAFTEADEANLLAEEDMHVFDCKPMVDPLHLVCCKNCKKPVKASQYATHAERCRTLNSTEETFFELNGGTGHKKPPRKGRKKLQTTHEKQGTTVREQERFGTIGGENTAASEPNAGDLPGTTSFSKETKRNAPSLGGLSVIDGSAITPGSKNWPTVVSPSGKVVSPSGKRTKLIAAEDLLISDSLKTASGTNSQEAFICHPLPLASKMYTSHRNLRLRSALNHLYHEASLRTQSGDSPSPLLAQENVMLPPQVSSPKNLSHDSESDVLPQKKDTYVPSAVRKPDQVLAQTSELCLENSPGYSSTVNLSNQLRDKNFSRPAVPVDTAVRGMIRSRYLPTAFSYPSNSGTSMTSIQQSNGSVPVI